MKKEIKLLIDTDIGDDIDDTLLLYYAMKQGYDIVGVTTVFGDTVARARLAKKCMTDFGCGYESTPVLPGYAKPHEPFPTALCQYTPDMDAATYAPETAEAVSAVEFILSAARRYGETLLILGVGPFSNLGCAMKADPALMNTVGGIYIMGGAYYRQYADWNVLSDVKSAATLFALSDRLTAFGADVTHKLALTEEESRRLLSVPAIAPYYKAWQSVTGKTAVLHDPLPLLAFEEEGLCEQETATVTVVTEGPGRGLTLHGEAYGKMEQNAAWAGVDKGRCTVARTVDAKRAIETFLRGIE